VEQLEVSLLLDATRPDAKSEAYARISECIVAPGTINLKLAISIWNIGKYN
jgi:hypothetical protein